MVLEVLRKFDYPGRFLILGTDPNFENNVCIYGLTGRSESSQERRLVQNCSRVSVRRTDKQFSAEDDKYRIYDAINIFNGGMVVSNGNQTDPVMGVVIKHKKIMNGLQSTFPLVCEDNDSLDALSKLTLGLYNQTFEMDTPNYTPRITGCISKSLSGKDTAAISIIRHVEHTWKFLSQTDVPISTVTLRDYFPFELTQGAGKLIATYTGENQNPLPSFRGEPLDVKLQFGNEKSAAKAVYDVLNPNFRVSVAAVYQNRESGSVKISIVNRHDSN